MSDTDSPDPVTDPARLAALRDADVLDTPVEEEFERLTALAAKLLRAPIALVSLVDSDRQYFKSVVGLDAPWGEARQTGLDMSVCQHVVRSGSALAIADTREHPLVQESHKIGDAGLAAYAGAPMTTADGHTLGSFCVIDSQPRAWQAGEMELLAELAASAVALIEQRAARARERRGTGAGSRGDAAGAAPVADATATLASADRVWESADDLLQALDAYDAMVRATDARAGSMQQQRAVRERVDAAQLALLGAAQKFGGAAAASLSVLPSALGAAARALWLAALYYIERESFRHGASARFQAGAGSVEEVERAALLVRSAQTELEEKAVLYRHARLERRTRPR